MFGSLILAFLAPLILGWILWVIVETLEGN